MKQVKIEINEEALLFYQRVASVLDRPTEEIISDYLTKLSEIMIRHLTETEEERE